MFGMWRSNGAGVTSWRFAPMFGVPRVAQLAEPVVGRSAAAAIAFEVARQSNRPAAAAPPAEAPQATGMFAQSFAHHTNLTCGRIRHRNVAPGAFLRAATVACRRAWLQTACGSSMELATQRSRTRRSLALSLGSGPACTWSPPSL
jgi:hypothetical protein